MNPSASSFTPSVNPASTPFEPSDPVNLSLARALAEKTDEVYTLRAALEAETSRRLEAEKELARVSMLNKSLTTSVQMLGSIVKFNAEKPSSETAAPNHRRQGDSSSVVSTPVDTPEAGSSGSILYDALKRQREQYEAQGYPTTTKHVENVAEPDPKSSNTTDQFDIGLLQHSDATDESHIAALSRTLRKHFFSSEESIKAGIRVTTTKSVPKSSEKHLLDSPTRSDLSKDSPSRAVVSRIERVLETHTDQDYSVNRSLGPLTRAVEHLI